MDKETTTSLGVSSSLVFTFLISLIVAYISGAEPITDVTIINFIVETIFSWIAVMGISFIIAGIIISLILFTGDTELDKWTTLLVIVDWLLFIAGILMVIFFSGHLVTLGAILIGGAL